MPRRTSFRPAIGPGVRGRQGAARALLADGRDVQLELNIVNRTYPEGRTSYNVVAEIPGTDKAKEVVMLGGHLDSWHAATGATDNEQTGDVLARWVRSPE